MSTSTVEFGVFDFLPEKDDAGSANDLGGIALRAATEIAKKISGADCDIGRFTTLVDRLRAAPPPPAPRSAYNQMLGGGDNLPTECAAGGDGDDFADLLTLPVAEGDAESLWMRRWEFAVAMYSKAVAEQSIRDGWVDCWDAD